MPHAFKRHCKELELLMILKSARHEGKTISTTDFEISRIENCIKRTEPGTSESGRELEPE